LCRLHRRRVIDELLRGCPFKDENALATLTRLQNDAWRRIGGMDLSGIELLARFRICNGCVGRLLAHPVIRRLRQKQEALRECPVTIPAATAAPVGVRITRRARR
jgi:hypothetical protein